MLLEGAQKHKDLSFISASCAADFFFDVMMIAASKSRDHHVHHRPHPIIFSLRFWRLACVPKQEVVWSSRQLAPVNSVTIVRVASFLPARA